MTNFLRHYFKTEILGSGLGLGRKDRRKFFLINLSLKRVFKWFIFLKNYVKDFLLKCFLWYGYVSRLRMVT